MEQKVTVSAVVPHDGKYLFVLDWKDKKWTLPGGRIEPDESTESAARREAREETGMHICVHTLVGVYRFASDRGNDITNFVYYATIIRKARIQKIEAIKVGYFSIAEIKALARQGQMRAPQAQLQPLRDYENGMRFCSNIVRLLRRR